MYKNFDTSTHLRFRDIMLAYRLGADFISFSSSLILFEQFLLQYVILTHSRKKEVSELDEELLESMKYIQLNDLIQIVYKTKEINIFNKSDMRINQDKILSWRNSDLHGAVFKSTKDSKISFLAIMINFVNHKTRNIQGESISNNLCLAGIEYEKMVKQNIDLLINEVVLLSIKIDNKLKEYRNDNDGSELKIIEQKWHHSLLPKNIFRRTAFKIARWLKGL